MDSKKISTKNTKQYCEDIVTRECERNGISPQEFYTALHEAHCKLKAGTITFADIFKGERCEACNKFVQGFEYAMCCNGNECGCMGLPMEPCACSQECFDKLISGTVTGRFSR